MTEDEKLLRKAKNCIQSAADNFMEATVGDYDMMGDVEGDLVDALKAIKELFKLRSDRYDAEWLNKGERDG